MVYNAYINIVLNQNNKCITEHASVAFVSLRLDEIIECHLQSIVTMMNRESESPMSARVEVSATADRPELSYLAQLGAIGSLILFGGFLFYGHCSILSHVWLGVWVELH